MSKLPTGHPRDGRGWCLPLVAAATPLDSYLDDMKDDCGQHSWQTLADAHGREIDSLERYADCRPARQVQLGGSIRSRGRAGSGAGAAAGPGGGLRGQCGAAGGKCGHRAAAGGCGSGAAVLGGGWRSADGRRRPQTLWFLDRDLQQVTVKPADAALFPRPPAMLLSGTVDVRKETLRSRPAPEARRTGLGHGRNRVAPRADFRRGAAGLRGQRAQGAMILEDKLGQNRHRAVRSCRAQRSRRTCGKSKLHAATGRGRPLERPRK